MTKFSNHAEFRRGGLKIAGVPIEGRDLPKEGSRGRGPGYSPRGPTRHVLTLYKSSTAAAATGLFLGATRKPENTR
jgi:hypothetical protein